MRFLLAILMLSSVAGAYDFNCRSWNSTSSSVRTGIVIGMAHIWGGVPTEYYIDHLHIMTARQTWLPEGITFQELEDGTTAVCKQPENGNLLYYQAMLLFIVKANGMSPSDWAAAAAEIRKARAR